MKMKRKRSVTVIATGKEKEEGKCNQELNAFGGASGLFLVAPSLVESRKTAEPTQFHSEADEGAKGVMMVDSHPHHPHKKKNSYYLVSTGRQITESPPPSSVLSSLSVLF